MGLLKHTDVKEGVIKATFMVIIFILATATRGDWLLVIVYLFRDQLQDIISPAPNNTLTEDRNLEGILQRWKLQNLHIFLALSITASFIMYYGMAWGWQWYYYIKRRDRSEEWKCQPGKFLKPEDERHEILLGSFNMLIGSTASGMIACYIMNGGYTKMYYSVSDYGWAYLIGSLITFYMYNEFMAYYLHRGGHVPFVYRHIHKWHHRYHQPTAFSAVAMHPAEFVTYQGYLAMVPFVVPIHVGVFLGVLLYTYYYGMCDHSGIKMDALWPWQPDSMYHDNHHKYFHVNFGFNSYLFDWLHDTLRREDRAYGEDVFGGHGKPISLDTDVKKTT